jgi:predicted DNA-binding protein (MmcQ/YjbR family)
LSLPDTKETLTWGKPHFRVGEKIFSGYGEENGKASIGFKLELAHAKSIIKDPRFWPAPYVGHKGWVSMDVAKVSDWAEVRSLIHESYRLIAPKKSLAKLSQTDSNPKPASKSVKAKATARSSARKKPSAKKPSAKKPSAKKPSAKKRKTKTKA